MTAAATATRPITDPWTERQIRLGLLAPGARGLTRCEAARQYNESHSLSPADPDFLYTPGAAQATARRILALVGIKIPPQTTVMLTDDDRTGLWCATYRVNPGQNTYAAEQHRQVTGEDISPHALLEALPWV